MSQSESSSSNRTFIIILAIVGTFVVLGLAVCAGAIYLAAQGFNQAMKPVKEMIQDVQQAPSVAESFLNDLRNNRMEAAYEATTDAFKKRMTQKQLQELVEKHPALKESADLQNMDMNQPAGQTFPGVYRFRYSARSKDGKDQVEVDVAVAKENGELKVDDFKVLQAENRPDGPDPSKK